MKARDTQPNKHDIHLIGMKYCKDFPLPNKQERAEEAPFTAATQGTHSIASELLVYMPQHSLMQKTGLCATRFATRIIQMR
jgi:hypothetical protein